MRITNTHALRPKADQYVLYECLPLIEHQCTDEINANTNKQRGRFCLRRVIHVRHLHIHGTCQFNYFQLLTKNRQPNINEVHARCPNSQL